MEECFLDLIFLLETARPVGFLGGGGGGGEGLFFSNI